MNTFHKEKKKIDQVQWFMPIISGTQEAEVRRITI
jgi:hypothetical protein